MLSNLILHGGNVGGIKFKHCITLLKVIIFIFHNLEMVPVWCTGALHYKKSTALQKGYISNTYFVHCSVSELKLANPAILALHFKKWAFIDGLKRWTAIHIEMVLKATNVVYANGLAQIIGSSALAVAAYRWMLSNKLFQTEQGKEPMCNYRLSIKNLHCSYEAGQ